MHGLKVNVKVLLRAFYKLTVVSLSLTAFIFSNFQFDYLNLWLQAVTYLYPHLVICQRAPPYNSENAIANSIYLITEEI